MRQVFEAHTFLPIRVLSARCPSLSGAVAEDCGAVRAGGQYLG